MDFTQWLNELAQKRGRWQEEVAVYGADGKTELTAGDVGQLSSGIEELEKTLRMLAGEAKRLLDL